MWYEFGQAVWYLLILAVILCAGAYLFMAPIAYYLGKLLRMTKDTKELTKEAFSEGKQQEEREREQE